MVKAPFYMWVTTILLSLFFGLCVYFPQLAPGFMIVSCLWLVATHRYSTEWCRPAGLVAIALLVWPAIAVFWSLDPSRGLRLVAYAGLIIAATFFLVQSLPSVRPQVWRVFYFGFPIVAIISIVDLATGMGLRLSALRLAHELFNYRKYDPWAAAHQIDIANFSIATVTLLVFPCLSLDGDRRPLKLAALLFVSLAAALTFSSVHASSKVALIGGCLAYGLAVLKPRLVPAALAAAWFLAIVLAPLYMMLAIEVNQRFAEALPRSFQHRLVIWNKTIQDISEHPWRGHGTGARRAVWRVDNPDRGSDVLFPVAAHSHNWFLDLWFELGGIGAALIGVVAAGLVYAIAKGGPSVVAFVSVVLCMSCFSFGLWEVWYLVSIALCGSLFALRPDHGA